MFHADTDALKRLTAVYRHLLPRASGTVLDIGSSWVSHLPEDRTFARVEGIGMNEAELKSNPRLDSWRVQDLNLAPDMRLEDEAYDAVLMCCALQYFKYPERLLSQVARALKPGGRLVLCVCMYVCVCVCVCMWGVCVCAASIAQRVSYVGGVRGLFRGAVPGNCFFFLAGIIRWGDQRPIPGRCARQFLFRVEGFRGFGV